MGRQDKQDRVKQQILAILSDGDELLNGIQIWEMMNERGLDISERSVRIYLNRLDDEGMIDSFGKKGRKITQKGLAEVRGNRLMERVGSMSTKIDRMTFSMSFDLALRRGTVVVNTALVSKEALKSRLGKICRVFEKGYAMGTLVSILHPGEKIGEIIVPPGSVGFCTVCSVTLNGVLLKHGIPTRSLFSGLLELENGSPTRFCERIDYEGTSIDPLQLFIRARMTDYLGAIESGNGRIGAGFREIPEESYELAISLAERLKSIGLGAFLNIGRPSREQLNIPVSQGSCGVIVIGGLNPVAILEETGVPVRHFALSGLMEYNRLFPYEEFKDRI